MLHSSHDTATVGALWATHYWQACYQSEQTPKFHAFVSEEVSVNKFISIQAVGIKLGQKQEILV